MATVLFKITNPQLDRLLVYWVLLLYYSIISNIVCYRGSLQGMRHVQKLLMLLPAIRECDLVMKGLLKERKGDIHMRNTLFLDMQE